MRIDWARARIGRRRGWPIGAVVLALCAAAAWIVGEPSATVALFVVGGLAAGWAVRGLRPGASSAAHLLDCAMGLPDAVSCAWDRRASDAPFDRLQRRDTLSKVDRRWPPELPDRPSPAWALLPLLWVGPFSALATHSDAALVDGSSGGMATVTDAAGGVVSPAPPGGARRAGPERRATRVTPPGPREEVASGDAGKGDGPRDPVEPGRKRADEAPAPTEARRTGGVGSAAGAVAAGASGVSRVRVGQPRGGGGATEEDARRQALFAQPLDPGDPAWPARPYPTRYGPAIAAWFARQEATEGEPR